MIHSDAHDWPLAVSTSREDASTHAIAQLMAQWTRWLDRGERFAILHLMTDAPTDSPANAVLAQVRDWMQEHAPDVRRNLLGLALVVPRGCPDDLRPVNTDPSQWPPTEVCGNMRSALNFLCWLIAPADGAFWNAEMIALRMQQALRENPAHPVVGSESRLT